MKTILVALDGSELAEQAIPAVSSLAAAAKADVVLAAVVVQPDRWPSATMPQESIGDERDYAEFYLSSVTDRLRGNGVRSRVRIEEGRVAPNAHHPQLQLSRLPKRRANAAAQGTCRTAPLSDGQRTMIALGQRHLNLERERACARHEGVDQ